MIAGLLQPTATDDGRAFDLLEIERKGVDVGRVHELQSRYELSDKALLRVLSINVRTWQRRRREEARLSPVESGRFLDVARVLAYASEVFGDDAKVNRWLRLEVPALDGERPLDLLATSTGRGIVNDSLTRIEHGVFD